MHEHLKESLIPWLRQSGFKGSHPWFYRPDTETLVLNLQSMSGGGAIRINYGKINDPIEKNAKGRKKQMLGVARNILGRSPPGDFWYIYQYASPETVSKRMTSDIEAILSDQEGKR